MGGPLKKCLPRRVDSLARFGCFCIKIARNYIHIVVKALNYTVRLHKKHAIDAYGDHSHAALIVRNRYFLIDNSPLCSTTITC